MPSSFLCQLNWNMRPLIPTQNTREEAREEIVLNEFFMRIRTGTKQSYPPCFKVAFTWEVMGNKETHRVSCPVPRTCAAVSSMNSQFSHFTFHTPLTLVTEIEGRLFRHTCIWFPT